MAQPENLQESAPRPQYWVPARCRAYDCVKTPSGALALCAPSDWWAAVTGSHQTMPTLAVEVWPMRGSPSRLAAARVCLAADDNGWWLFTAVWEGLGVRGLLAPTAWAGLSPADLAIERVVPRGRPDLILYSEVYPVTDQLYCGFGARVTAPPSPYVPFYALRRHRLLTRFGVYGYKPMADFGPGYLTAGLPGLGLVADAAWLGQVCRSPTEEVDLWVVAPDGGAHRLLSSGTCSALPMVADVWGRAGTYVFGLKIAHRTMTTTLDPPQPGFLIERVVPRGRAWPILYSEAYPLEVLLNCLAAEPAGRELPPRRSRWSSWITRFRPW